MWQLFWINCFSTVLAGILLAILGFSGYSLLYKKKISQGDIKQKSKSGTNLNINNIETLFVYPVSISDTKDNLANNDKIKKSKNI